MEEISSLNYYDTVCIIAQYNCVALGIKTVDYSGRGYTQDMIDQMKASETFKPHESCGIKFTKPFDMYKCEYFFTYKDIHEAYEFGILPFEGGLLDQPGWVIDVIKLFTSLKRETELRQIQESTRVKGKNRNRHS